MVLHSGLVGLRTLQVEQRTSSTRLLQLSNLSKNDHGTLLALKPLTPSANRQLETRTGTMAFA